MVFFLKVVFLIGGLFGVTGVFAATGGGGQLGLEAPVQVLVDALTGPWLFGVSTLAMVLALAQLAFGGELGAVGRSLIFLILVITLLINIVNVMGSLFTGGITLSSEAGFAVASALSLVAFSYVASGILNSILEWKSSFYARKAK